ncbi:protein kinase domain-containing protein [Sorangium sp. So ce1000]|uniref:protein kinase domain-containing protein n=1 Tax=Sorangium sp. So ce1000 TaxID=3133325 RepID=UPI003F61FCAB
MSAGPQLIGKTIAGRFRVTGFIGEGAMAAVYRGEQDAEPRDVAIKIMHPQLLGDETFVTRFYREAKAASRLHHPNTVQILDSGVEGHLPYIVMELVSGQDLFELLLAERRFSEARAARFLIGITDALAAAHARGIVHRDLKPENVMVVRDPSDPSAERVKVLDFGIAKMVEGGPRGGEDGPNSAPISVWGSVTTVGVVVGTPAYMSPEQCRGDVIDGRSDVYACGVLLFLLVTGRLPFPPTRVVWEVAMDHLRKPPPAPSQFLPQIHPALEAIILTALAKWPTQRQQSARELHDELERLLPHLSEALLPAARTSAPEDAPTVESTMPPSLRSTMTAAPPLREGDLPPPAQRGEALARSIFREASLADGPPSSAILSLAATLPGGALAREALSGPTSDDLSRTLPAARRLVAPTSDPPASDVVIHDRKDFGLPFPAAEARAPSPRPEAPRGAGAAGAAAPPRPPSRSSAESVIEIAPAPVRRDRRPPARPTDLWMVRLVVPLALVIGLALGVLAFFLSR